MSTTVKTALVALLLGLNLAPSVSFAAHRETERDIAPGSDAGPGTPGGLVNPGDRDNDGQSPAMNVPTTDSYGAGQGTSSSSWSAPGADSGSSDWQMPS